MGKAKANRGNRVIVYLDDATLRDLRARQGQEQERRPDERVTVSTLIGEWIARELARGKGR